MTELSFSCVSVGGECDDPHQLKNNLLDAIEHFRRIGFDEEEFGRIKKAFFGSFIRSFNNVETIGGLLCRNFLSNVDVTEFPEVYNTITTDTLKEILDEVFCPDNCAMSIVWPTK